MHWIAGRFGGWLLHIVSSTGFLVERGGLKAAAATRIVEWQRLILAVEFVGVVSWLRERGAFVVREVEFDGGGD